MRSDWSSDLVTENIGVTIVHPRDMTPTEVSPEARAKTAIGSAAIYPISPAVGTEELKINAIYFEPGSRFRPHRHAFDQILYYQYGTGLVAVDGGEDILVPEGSYVILPANTVHMHGCTDDGPALQLSLMRDTQTDFDVQCPEQWRGYLDGTDPKLIGSA
jgi:quercetin dioxygenase-like cupin family protein